MGAPQLFAAGPTTGGTPVGGSGTPGTIPVWSSGTTLGNSIIKQNSTPNQIALGAAGTARSWFVNRLAMEIGDSSSPVAAIVNPIGGGTLQLGMNWYNEPTGAAYQYLTSNFATRYEQTAGTHVFFRAASGTAGNTISWLESARIDSSGNVGIGTNAPAASLDVNGQQYLTSSTTGNEVTIRTLSFYNAAGVTSQRMAAVSGINDASDGATSPMGGHLALLTTTRGQSSPAERMRITSAGNVGIGTASPGAQLHVERAGGTATNTEYLRLRNTTNATNSNASISFFVSNNVVATGAISHTAASGPSYDTIFSNWNGSTLAEAMRITQGGNVYAASGTTGMTTGFFYIPAAAGAPTGTPTAISGRVPMYYDTTNDQFYIRNGANWRKVTLT